MAGYESFGQFYDILQKDVPYKSMAETIHSFIQKYSSEKEVVVDLACGTGNLSCELLKLGYDVIGVDLSEEMLNLADSEEKNPDGKITYLCQNMTELDLWGQTDVMVCALDSLNHLGNFSELSQVFDRAEEFIYKGGLFIFDVNTLYKHKKILADNAFVYDYDNLYCVWQNQLNEDNSVDIFLDFFKKTEKETYKRFHEEFSEILFETKQLEKLIKQKNFEIMGIYDGYSENPLNEKSQRALYVCRKL